MSLNKSVDEQAAQVDCAWCGEWFETVLELLSHVEVDHLEPPVSAA